MRDLEILFYKVKHIHEEKLLKREEKKINRKYLENFRIFYNKIEQEKVA